MYATLTMFPIKPDMRENIEKVADNLLPFMRGMKGFKSMTFIVNPEETECGAFAVWESQEDVEAAWEISGPKTQEVMADIVTAPPTRRVFEIYEPKT